MSRRSKAHSLAGQHNTPVRGFTLIEILLVIVIISILVTVAIPSYSEYVKKARRTDGQVALINEIQSLQRCNNTTFTFVGCSLSATASLDSHYQIALSNTTATAYTLTATAVGAQATDEECKVMSINGQGIRTPDPDTSPCWSN